MCLYKLHVRLGRVSWPTLRACKDNEQHLMLPSKFLIFFFFNRQLLHQQSVICETILKFIKLTLNKVYVRNFYKIAKHLKYFATLCA